MKDIKQYFVNGTKVVNEEIAADLDDTTEQKKQQQEKTVATRKRSRVKIRISHTSSKERMCDIIESKTDLIDKTPSPFNVMVNDCKQNSGDETPKSCLIGIKQCFKENSKSAVEVNENQSENTKDILQHKKEINEHIIVDLYNSNSMKNVRNVPILELDDEIGSQREESNAFQVLMNRDKPIQYKLPSQQSKEDIECKEKSDYTKELRSKHKEKLLALADKKGYSKRKIVELEEIERIEKNIENRIKFLKGENRSDMSKKDDSVALLIKNNKQPSGNLLDYFSKSPLELTNKNEKCVSTFIVKADVHRTDNSDIEPTIKPTSNKIYCNKKCSKSRCSELDLSTVDDIHIVTSENLSTPQSAKHEKQKAQKPRWSLRIKLHSTEDNDFLDDTDDELFSPRSKSKFNTSIKSRNSVNIEDNVSLKDYNEHIKTKIHKEKKELISKQKESNIPSTVKDAIIIDNNGDANPCLTKSSGTNRYEQKIKDTNKTIITITDDSECEIINENILKRKVNEKLAPVFIKRRKTDPAIMAARRLFLQSEIIDVENENTDRKANNSIFMLPFPAISHVTQLEDKSDSIRSEIKHKFPMKVERIYLPSIDISNYKCITNYMKVSKVTDVIDGPVKGNFNQVLSEIEKLYPDVRIMWKTVSTIKGDVEKKSPTRMKGKRTKALERKRILTKVENEENQLHDCTWMCKYKPMTAQEIVGNEEAADKLKSWLSGWRASLTRENDGSSGDEFYSSDCSSSCNNENNQVAVLLGPYGSGKSASVYAIAEELGYSVLEVNASSRRTGKRILKELEEATKSHRIKKNKHKSLFKRVANESEASKISQNSLILLEDIDLIFEEDEGFVSATYQLASNTKRPIVMTCRNVCPHLSKMAPQQNKIYFQKVNGNRVSALLELISLAETGYRLPHNCLMKLLQMGDLRQALLQLQYLLLSGPPVLSEQSTPTNSSLWQDAQRYLYKPAIKLNKKHKKKKSTNTKRSNDTACILNDLSKDLDSLSLVSSLIDVEDTTLNMENMQPNLSLAENVSFYSASRDLSLDIAIFISDRILYKNSSINEPVQNQNNIILRKQLNQGVDLALSHVTSTCLDRRVMALDYLPTARTICRAEESRSTSNYKRGSRFFHYLHSLKVPTVSMKPNILAAACRMLQEKKDKTMPASIVSVTYD